MQGQLALLLPHGLCPGPVTPVPYLPGDLNDVANPLGEGVIHADLVAAGATNDAVRAYLASIAFVDEALGIVLDAWEASTEDWLVIVWGDHGFMLGEKDRWLKAVLWEEANRTPLMMAGPGIPAGLEIDMPASLLDIYPTMIEQASLTPKPELEGRSLVSLIANPTASFQDIPVVSDSRGDHLSYRSQRWRYMEHQTGSEELYDHDIDPNEWNNLAGDPQYDSLILWLTPEPGFAVGIGLGLLTLCALRDRSLRASHSSVRVPRVPD